MSKISLDKQYRTRDGREVRIYAVDGGGGFPVHGAIREDGVWDVFEWTIQGLPPRSITDEPLSLIEVRPRIKRTVWLNVYSEAKFPDSGRGVSHCVYFRKDSADLSAGPDRIACVKVDIDVEEGHGL